MATINPNAGTGFSSLSGMQKPSDVPTIRLRDHSDYGEASQKAGSSTDLPTVPDVEKAEKARAKLFKKAADMYANIYAVRDHTVSIFKNQNGEYQFRIRNLETGEIKQIPEPEIIDFMDRQAGIDMSVLKFDA